MQRWVSAAAVVAAHLCLLCSGSAIAQVRDNQGMVIRDGSIGNALGGIVEPGRDDRGRYADYLIRGDLGQLVGGNLFHSFDRFSVGTGEVATFTVQGLPAGAPAVANVISRVTGRGPDFTSDIDGTLRSTIPAANLYLLNPNGVMFRENARLDVQGSFHASTADALRLDEGEVFAVGQDRPEPLLYVPQADHFGFVGSNSAPLSVSAGALLSVSESALSMIGGGGVSIEGTLEAFQVIVVGDDIEIAGEVRGESSDFPGGRPTVTIGGESVRIEEGGFVFSRLRGGEISIQGEESVVIRGGDILFFGTPTVRTAVLAQTIDIRGGDVSIEKARVRDFDGIEGGRISIAADDLEITEGFIHVNAENEGEGGVIDIEASRAVIRGGSRLTADHEDSGEAGGIEIRSAELFLSGSSSLQAIGGGSIDIRSAFVEMTDGAAINSSAPGLRDAGGIRIQASNILRLVSSRITSDAEEAFGGSIAINGQSIRRRADGSLEAVKAQDATAGFLVELLDSEISANVGTGTGDGGNVLIDPVFLILDDSRITANAGGEGDGGNILIVADNILSNRPLDEVLNASSRTGLAGTVEVRAPDLNLADALASLPESLLDASALLGEACAARGSDAGGSFAVQGRDGAPPWPDGWLRAGVGPGFAGTGAR